jgi:hypothetical protein
MSLERRAAEKYGDDPLVRRSTGRLAELPESRIRNLRARRPVRRRAGTMRATGQLPRARYAACLGQMFCCSSEVSFEYSVISNWFAASRRLSKMNPPVAPSSMTGSSQLVQLSLRNTYWRSKTRHPIKKESPRYYPRGAACVAMRRRRKWARGARKIAVRSSKQMKFAIRDPPGVSTRPAIWRGCLAIRR